MDETALDEIDGEVERIEQGGNAWLDTDQVVAVEVRRPLDKVVPIRLSAEHWRVRLLTWHRLTSGSPFGTRVLQTAQSGSMAYPPML